MRILHVLRSNAWGGLELYSLDFIQQLKNTLGIEGQLLAVPHSKVWLEAEKRNIAVRSSWPSRKSIDAIHVHRRQDLPAARFRLINSSKKFFYSLYMSAPAKKDLYHRWIYSRLDGLASSSEWVCENVRKNFPVRGERVHCIRYGRLNQIPVWSPDEILNFRQQNGAQPGDLVICSMSRIDPEKGVGTLAQAFLKLSPSAQKRIRLWIIGDPTLLHRTADGNNIYEEASLQLDRELKEIKHPRIHLIPFQSQPEGFLQSSDLFYLGSTEETYSLAVIDAFLRAKPVLGTYSGGTIEQLADSEPSGNSHPRGPRGFFFEPKNTDSLCSQLEILAETSDSELHAFGQRAQLWAQHEHNWSTTLEKWKNIYNLPLHHIRPGSVG